MISSFKPNPASMVATVVNEETGEERKRLINKGRWKGYGPATVTFGDLNVGSRLGYFVSILHSIDPRKSNPGRATSPKSSKAGTPGTCHAGCMNPSYSSDITINTSTSWCEIVQSGHVLPCTISSVPRRLERYTSEVSFLLHCHVISLFAVPKFCFLLFAIRSRMGPGGILLFASNMTQERIQRLDCKHSVESSIVELSNKSDSYQRIYFRNANHPMSRVSIVSRRQEGRSAATYITRSVEQEEAMDVERR